MDVIKLYVWPVVCLIQKLRTRHFTIPLSLSLYVYALVCPALSTMVLSLVIRGHTPLMLISTLQGHWRSLTVVAGVLPFLCPYAITGMFTLPPGYTDLVKEGTRQSVLLWLHMHTYSGAEDMSNRTYNYVVEYFSTSGILVREKFHCWICRSLKLQLSTDPPYIKYHRLLQCYCSWNVDLHFLVHGSVKC